MSKAVSGAVSLTCSVRIDPSQVSAQPQDRLEAIAQTPDPPPDRESLRVLLIGSRQGVLGTIQTLYRLGFADVAEWSPLLPAPTPGEVMSILTRYIMPPSAQ